MYESEEKFWNMRKTHMFETLTGRLKFSGEDARAVVWAHNTHVGNIRAMSIGSR
jgi:erythromycin esterase-like protein